MDTIVCPIDNKDDAIQKVSAIVGGIRKDDFSMPYRGYTTDGEYVTGHRHVTGISMTELQKQLTLPDEPKQPQKSMWGNCIVLAVMLLTICPYYFCVASGSMFLFSPESSLGKLVDSLANNYGEGIVFTPLLVVALVVILAILLLPYGILFLIAGRMEKTRLSKRMTKFAVDRKIWDAAKKRWDRLYYCHKHGIVFDPNPESGMDETCEPANFEAFVYQTSKS